MATHQLDISEECSTVNQKREGKIEDGAFLHGAFRVYVYPTPLFRFR